MADKLAENNPVDSSTQNETLASSVYHALLDDILAGKLIPGHKLRLGSVFRQPASQNCKN